MIREVPTSQTASLWPQVELKEVLRDASTPDYREVNNMSVAKGESYKII